MQFGFCSLLNSIRRYVVVSFYVIWSPVNIVLLAIIPHPICDGVEILKANLSQLIRCLSQVRNIVSCYPYLHVFCGLGDLVLMADLLVISTELVDGSDSWEF